MQKIYWHFRTPLGLGLGLWLVLSHVSNHNPNPLKSIASCCHGPSGMGASVKGSYLCWGVVAWQARHDRTKLSIKLSIVGNHICERKYAFILVMAWCPSCARAIKSALKEFSITIQVPRSTSCLATDNSPKTHWYGCNSGTFVGM